MTVSRDNQNDQDDLDGGEQDVQAANGDATPSAGGPSDRRRPAPPADAPGHGWVAVDPQDARVLWMVGEVDISVVERAGPGLQAALVHLEVVDAGELTFVDSMGLHCLITAATAARARGSVLVLRRPTVMLGKALRLLGLDHLVQVQDRQPPATAPPPPRVTRSDPRPP